MNTRYLGILLLCAVLVGCQESEEPGESPKQADAAWADASDAGLGDLGGDGEPDGEPCEVGATWCVGAHRVATCTASNEVKETSCPEEQICFEGECDVSFCDTIEEGYCLIPAGTFIMGASEGDWWAEYQERPRHKVTLTRSFLLKTTEVTLGEWERFFEVYNRNYMACGPDCPILFVMWWEAAAYCNALSEEAGLEPCYLLEGCPETTPGNWEDSSIGDDEQTCDGVTFLGLDCPGYRLPTEAEWEYAARAGTTTSLYSGGNLENSVYDEDLKAVAWFGYNSEVDYSPCTDLSRPDEFGPPAPSCAGPNPVGLKEPNPWGLYDMLGNAKEFVNDWTADPFAYEAGPVVDPLGAEESLYKAARGGGWCNPGDHCRTSFRGGLSPGARTSPKSSAEKRQDLKSSVS